MLLPEEILDLISYKQTYQALESGDEDALAQLLSSFVRISMQGAYRRFEHIEQKREKKFLLKAHVYLDALITLNRMATQIQKSVETLSQDFFKGLDIDAVRAILEKFTEVQEINRGEIRNKRGNQDQELDLPDVKFVKTKDLQKLLLCNIIGVSVYLAFNQRIRASVLARTLKKEVGDLKNFFKELGLQMEAMKNEKTGEPDIMVYIAGSNYTKEKKESAKRERAKSADKEEVK